MRKTIFNRYVQLPCGAKILAFILSPDLRPFLSVQAVKPLASLRNLYFFLSTERFRILQMLFDSLNAYMYL